MSHMSHLSADFLCAWYLGTDVVDVRQQCSGTGDERGRALTVARVAIERATGCLGSIFHTRVVFCVDDL